MFKLAVFAALVAVAFSNVAAPAICLACPGFPGFQLPSVFIGPITLDTNNCQNIKPTCNTANTHIEIDGKAWDMQTALVCTNQKWTLNGKAVESVTCAADKPTNSGRH
ncbi:unnamed protein product, partial [Mesorhabditis spiculigera]